MAFQKFSLLMLGAAVFIAIGCTKNSSSSSDEEFVPQWAKTGGVTPFFIIWNAIIQKPL